MKIAKEIGDRAGEGRAYGNLGNAYWSLGVYRKAIEYHGTHLKIAVEIGDRAGERTVQGNFLFLLFCFLLCFVLFFLFVYIVY